MVSCCAYKFEVGFLQIYSPFLKPKQKQKPRTNTQSSESIASSLGSNRTGREPRCCRCTGPPNAPRPFPVQKIPKERRSGECAGTMTGESSESMSLSSSELESEPESLSVDTSSESSPDAACTVELSRSFKLAVFL